MRIGRFRIGADAVLCLSTLFLLESSRFIAVIAVSSAAHELGHLLALRLCGAEVREMRLGAAGAEIVWSGALRLSQELICALAGPASGLLLALAAAKFEGGRILAGASFSLSLFNLLPVMPLDGGRAVFALCSIFCGFSAATKLLRASGFAVSAAILALGAWVAGKTGGNFGLFIMGLWLAYQTVAKSGEIV